MRQLYIFIGMISITLLGCTTTNWEQKKHVAELSGIRSINSAVSTSITFINNSERIIKIYWIDGYGKRKLYNSLLNGQAYTQPTYLTHPWLITDENDNPWWLYYPDATARTIEIRQPAYK